MPNQNSSPSRCPEAIILGVISLLSMLACAACFHEVMFSPTATGVVLSIAVLEVALLLGLVANELARKHLIRELERTQPAAQKPAVQQPAEATKVTRGPQRGHVTQTSYGTYVSPQQAYSMNTGFNVAGEGHIPPGTTAFRSKPFDSPNYVYGGTLTRCSSREKLVINRPMVWVGRGNQGVDLRVEGNNGISRMHARVTVRGGAAYICDNNTHNGTFVNNARLVPGHEQRLVPGDILYLGSERFQYDW